MDQTESEFFAKAKDVEVPGVPPPPRTNWTIPIIAAAVAVGAIVVWRLLVQPAAAPRQAVEPPPGPLVKAPDPAHLTFSDPPATEPPVKPPPPPKGFGN